MTTAKFGIIGTKEQLLDYVTALKERFHFKDDAIHSLTGILQDEQPVSVIRRGRTIRYTFSKHELDIWKADKHSYFSLHKRGKSSKEVCSGVSDVPRG